MNDEQVRELMLEILAPRLEAAGLTPAELDDSVSLVDIGVLDSLAFLELASDIEGRTGRMLDLSDADPAEFTTVSGFIRALRA